MWRADANPSLPAAHPGARVPRPAGAPAGRPNAQLLPTLFDRLRDEAPSQAQEPHSAYTVTARQMRDIVQRDLTLLLNTTSAEDLIDRQRYPEAAASTLNYGVRPLAGDYLSERKWGDIEQVIKRAILDYEPRLIPDSLKLRPLMKEGARDAYNVLLFEIRAMVHLKPYPLEITVQSSIDLETNRMSVESAAPVSTHLRR